MNNLKKAAYDIRMTDQEKSAMKAQIFGVPSDIPAQPSTYFAYNFQFLHSRVFIPLSLVLVVLVGGTGTAAAAHGSLPGDLLYPVKLSINEGVELALATTPVAKAEVSAKLAERRVEEAETLASRGELNAEVGQEIAANFEEHAETAASLAADIETEDPDAATNLRAKLDSSLVAHGAILAMLTQGGAQQNQEGAGVVAAKVLARTSASARVAYAPAALRAAKAAPAASQSMMMVASDTATATEASHTLSLESDSVDERPAGNEHAALRAQERATEAFAATRELFENSKDDLSGAVITQVSGEFASIQTQMDLGSTTLASGHFDEAAADYAEALSRMTRLGVLLKAQARLDVNIITPILEGPMEVDAPIDVDLL